MNFNRTIQDIRDGQLLNALNDKLAEVIAAVADTGKVGSLTLTLKIKANGEDALTISSDVKAKTPEAAVGDAIFFTDGTNLFRRNPRQADIEDEIAKKRAEREEAVS